MAKPNIAKENVIAKIKAAFGSDYVGEESNKHYVWADGDNGKVQIAISLTQPKVPFGGDSGTVAVQIGDFNFEESVPVVSAAPFQPATFSEDERNNVAELMARLGL